ncbi:MAG: YabP/YqfC family sporulation protein [Clostridia bacterium]|nr:YabP/YqfC family sporulation protein [Clostridia bacterium]MDE7329326.1 YabP/YqfC family sporulation protein [Clostridia bacterium]
MSYKKEIQSKIKGNLDGVTNFYTLTVGKDYAVVEGHKGVLSFDESSISVRLKKGKVDFTGEDLRIASSQKEELVIKGKVTNIAFDGVWQK